MFYISLIIPVMYISLVGRFLSNKIKNILFNTLFITLFIISSIRYGSGTDYFSYRDFYYYIVSEDIIEAINQNIHIDIGFRVLFSICKSIDLSFENFIFILNIFIFYSYYIVIKKYSKDNILSLFILFANYYLIYINSIVRQGFVMPIFILLYYNYINDRRIVRYILCTLFLSLFHSVALIALIVPLLEYLYRKFEKLYFINILIIIFSFLGFIFNWEVVIISFLNRIGMSIPYISTESNILAILARLCTLSFAYICYKKIPKNSLNYKDKITMYIYFINTFLFISISHTQTLSRATDLISSIEIIFLANIISSVCVRGLDIFMRFGIIIIMSMLFLNDLNAETYNGNYYKKGAINYPYITIFNKEEILKYRSIN